ncbi:uncharacterized protein BDZ99DRAFT_527918 [Mytilinidion resinicola]|uniref:Fungal N-terminal domain-containing protein n=1 Tax=Mytilinidion resinicola TaxID=574789 RepID=A0A6A6XZY2_9PEZI|nr:uncharacterized protein BDZ99DRAFT_527918 [Mytilinidion resinicola]KAF2801960.1 hypothetical protein BDZ99DRAFT_527918 [Mytilinidion resinicola]
MSFGISITDITTLVHFAWTTYRRAKSASSSFAEVACEALSLHTVLQKGLDDVSDPDSALSKRGPTRRVEFDQITSNCNTALAELDALVKKYKGLGTNSQRTWERVKFGQEELDTIRSKLSLHVQMVNLFLTSLHGHMLDRIERKIDVLVAEINSGQREPSVLTVAEEDNEGQDIWEMLKSELLEEGITGDDIEQHKIQIKTYIQHLLFETSQPPSSLGMTEDTERSKPNAGTITTLDGSHVLGETCIRLRPHSSSLETCISPEMAIEEQSADPVSVTSFDTPAGGGRDPQGIYNGVRLVRYNTVNFSPWTNPFYPSLLLVPPSLPPPPPPPPPPPSPPPLPPLSTSATSHRSTRSTGPVSVSSQSGKKKSRALGRNGNKRTMTNDALKSYGFHRYTLW